MPDTTRFQQAFAPAVPHAKRFSDLVRSLEPPETAAVVPGVGWTAVEVAAHVATVLDRYVRNHRRSSNRSELAAQNAEELRTLADAEDVGVIADAIDGAMAQLAAVAPHLPLEQEFPFHMDLSVSASAGWANLLSELLVHGDDIARATGRSWPFPDRDVEGIWRTLIPAARGWLRPGTENVDEVYEFVFAAFGPVTVWIHDGVVSTDDAPRGADHSVAVADAVAFTLAVPWRRRLVSDGVSALFLSRFYDI